MMPILVSQRVDVSATGERRDALDQRLPRFLAECGLRALPVPNLPDLAGGWFDQPGICGVLLSGGNDLSAYGGDAPERDACEQILVEQAVARSLPVLGLCRGMQMLTHLFGGTLTRIEGHVARPHPALVDGESRLLNSYHNFGVATVPPGFAVFASAADGTVEGIRATGSRLLGIHWHPEREDVPHAADVALFRGFFVG